MAISALVHHKIAVFGVSLYEEKVTYEILHFIALALFFANRFNLIINHCR